MHKTDIVICGAGITGISAAYFLARMGITHVTLVDERAPLDLTSSRSTECYRNWWPDPEMLGLMNRSIDLMEGMARESGNVFALNRRGYLFVTAQENKIPAMQERAERISRLGAGPVRLHTRESSTYQPARGEGFEPSPQGADLLIGSDLLLEHFPYLSPDSAAALHVRRAGWMSAQQLGMFMLETAKQAGVRFVSGRVAGVDTEGGRVSRVRLANGESIPCGVFINAAGPYLRQIGALLGLDLPVFTELHLRAVFKDHLGVIGRDAPLLIWDDPQELPWDAEERDALAADPETRWLTGHFPSGVHARPEGGHGSEMALLLWEYQTKRMEPTWPPVFDEQYPEIALRGMATMIPGLKRYFGRMPRPLLDGGYYTKTRENRPLVGPLPVEGAYVIGAVSGYGIMSACGAGELLAAHITGASLPAYAPAFLLSRYQDPAYLQQLEAWGESGQL